MDNRSFNLVTEPWIKVIDKKTDQERKVSLTELFRNAQNYRQLAGEMRSQDLAILRFLLAILTTIYSRFDAEGTPYDWLKVDRELMQATGFSDQDEEDEEEDSENQQVLLDTWEQLFKAGRFSEIVLKYLQKYASRFDLFGETPFYQVTENEYNALVPKKKQISGAKGPGSVAIKQIDRQVSESAHTPAIFTPKSGQFKNRVALDELARWLITYQNFTGVTDKTKITTKDKFSASRGWLYSLNPVYADGDDLFQTLMLNLILINPSRPDGLQKPVWEYNDIQDYVFERRKQLPPDNLAALYTTWSRILHVDWTDGHPTIFSACIPMFDSESTFVEPMTTWRRDKKNNGYKPAVKSLRSLGIAMWRNFGQYVNPNQSDDIHDPGIVLWLQRLKDEGRIPYDSLLTLASAVLISDGNATSQSPVAEVYDDMHINANVLFDENKAFYWPERIEEVIETTQRIGDDYWRFAANIARIRNLDGHSFANRLSAKFYEQLNDPFKEWLAGLTNQDERDQKINLWKKQLRTYVLVATENVVQSSSPRDMSGIPGDNGLMTIFTVTNQLRYQVAKDLG
ncbi:type I-E CRISPR-associated protein Cse1/CasA [Lentilactobacillus raoultii]|uniref:Type I-E CRISPR-associated protein Cse1/CasA n=1 Tax=Lentilactobacillus raoultii TaxID=1987503 RepID=A0ABW3PHB4_9LACO|nr:type I-E CRISPR-associated protein Cse1/CasA [Lentilactobacillus raoultii]